jgi:hypothetical protein
MVTAETVVQALVATAANTKVLANVRALVVAAADRKILFVNAAATTNLLVTAASPQIEVGAPVAPVLDIVARKVIVTALTGNDGKSSLRLTLCMMSIFFCACTSAQI